ncbi:MAG TPA: hypothetical protein VFS60_12720 [Thermoanaerobaculia bacterium]|nr:hypothetical protein [Thermoanaerobaculia bacterium]
MATTTFQRGILRLLAPSRKERESRRSQNIDLFHDTREAVAASVAADRRQLADAGYELAMQREAPTFAEAEVRRGAESTLIQWTQDSAFRFFPLCENEELGLTLHPFDLATNKALAMAGRLEAPGATRKRCSTGWTWARNAWMLASSANGGGKS